MKLRRVDPPHYLLLFLTLIVALHLFLPAATVVPPYWNTLGTLPLVAGIVLNLMADRSFKERKTSVKPLGATNALITDGAFKISRHPMYLGFVLMLFGVAMLTGSATAFLPVAIFWVFMDTVFVRFEEAKLATLFGDSWSSYADEVRRWI